jgi:hypothetical protein
MHCSVFLQSSINRQFMKKAEIMGASRSPSLPPLTPLKGKTSHRAGSDRHPIYCPPQRPRNTPDGNRSKRC